MFIEKFKTTQKGLYSFFLERLEQINFNNIPEDIVEELKEFKEKRKDFNIQLANRLTLIEFFKYIFIRTYEDFQLIHKVEEGKVIPVTFGESISSIKYTDIDDFNEKYINQINKISFKDIGEQFFQGFSSLFRKYEIFIEEVILEGDTIEEEFDKEYYSRLFDIIYFLNEFYFGGLESEGDDIIGRLYETSLERADRKKFGQFYTPRYVIDFILEELEVNPTENIKIADLSCGTGGFLMKYLSKIKGDILIDEDGERLKNIFLSTYGIDIKIFSILLTKLNLALIFIIKNKFLIERNFQTHKLDTKNIITGDGLEINSIKKLEDNSFDYIVGNPPYVGIKGNADIFERIKNDLFFSKHFTRKSDLYYFFVIYGIEKLKVGGKLGYIFPREWMTADFANKLREYILKNTKILKIIDLNGISIFEDAGTSSLILFLEKIDINKKEEQLEDYNFDYIKFKNFKDKNIIKYIDEFSEELQTKTTDNKKQTVLTGFETFSQKILNSKNFNKIIDNIKNQRSFDISYLGGFTSNKLILNDFINIKNIKQNTLTDKPWIFGIELVEKDYLVPLNDILSVSNGILTGCNKVTQNHIDLGIKKQQDFGRGIFVLKEGIDIKGEGLEDLRRMNNNIGKIYINLYENGGWTELNKEEKHYIKPLFGGKNLNKWSINKSDEFLIFYHINNYSNLEKGENLQRHFLNYKVPLLNRAVKTGVIMTEEIWQNLSPQDLTKYYSPDGSTLSNLSKRLWNLIPKYIPNLNFETPKIATSSRDLRFTFSNDNSYGLSGINYIFLNDKNIYTKTIEKYSKKEDYLKFINAILNSKTIIDYFKSNNFNFVSLGKLKELKIPKVDFNNEEHTKRYFKIIELANKLIEIYNIKNNEEILNNLSIKTNKDNKILEKNSEEIKNLLNTYNFEIYDEEILFGIKIKNIIYYGFERFKEKLISGRENNLTIGQIIGLNNEKEKEENISIIEKEIDSLVEYFYV